MKLHPCAGFVVIKRSEANTTSKGGIVLPDAAKDKPSRGKIVAVGKGKLLDNGEYGPVEAREGTVAVFRAYSANEFEIEGEEFVVVSMEEIMAVLDS